jgi:hypothetical protein
MKGFRRYFRGWLDEPFNSIGLGILCVIGLIIIWSSLRDRYPRAVGVDILGDFAGILLFALMAITGILAIHQKYLPVFIIPITGIPAVILGILLSIIGFYFGIRWIWHDILLFFSLVK